MRWALLILPLLLFRAEKAFADDQPQVNVMSGDWISGQMVDGLTTDVCFAGGDQARFMFRSDKEDLEIRTSDSNWSLSADATGSMTVKAGAYNHTFGMVTFSSTTLTAVVAPSDVESLLDAFDKSSVATLTFGPTHTTTVSLSGSTKALNDWRACTGTHDFADLGESAGKTANPFK